MAGALCSASAPVTAVYRHPPQDLLVVCWRGCLVPTLDCTMSDNVKVVEKLRRKYKQNKKCFDCKAVVRGGRVWWQYRPWAVCLTMALTSPRCRLMSTSRMARSFATTVPRSCTWCLVHVAADCTCNSMALHQTWRGVRPLQGHQHELLHGCRGEGPQRWEPGTQGGVCVGFLVGATLSCARWLAWCRLLRRFGMPSTTLRRTPNRTPTLQRNAAGCS